MTEENANGKGSNQNWVKFDDESQSGSNKEYNGAVINAETTQVNIEKTKSDKPENRNNVAAVITPEAVHINIPKSKPTSPEPSTNVKLPVNNVPLRSIDLRDSTNGRLESGQTVSRVGNAVIRQGFANGEIIVTLLPVNAQWPWITPAKFRPELVPEELMAQGLTLTVEDYVHVMELLTNDVRFNLYNVCYKRILFVWILTAFIVLIGLLVSGTTGLTLFGLGVMWLIINVIAIFLCVWIKIKLNRNLEKCLGQVNKHLIKHKIMLGLDDRGKISCHKVNLCFIYFDSADCIKKLQEVIEREEREGRPVNQEETAEERRQRARFRDRMDIDDSDIIIQGSNTAHVSRKQERAEILFLRYSSRWVKLFVRQLLELNVDSRNRHLPVTAPRHCAAGRCPCQFVEEHLKYKPRGNCCMYCAQGADIGGIPSYPFLP